MDKVGTAAGVLPVKDQQDIVLSSFRQATQDYILSKYDLPRQSSFNMLIATAIGSGLKNRLNYVLQVEAWLTSLFQYHFKISKTIQTSDQNILSGVTWDFSQFDATDPQISIEAAMQIPD